MKTWALLVAIPLLFAEFGGTFDRVMVPPPTHQWDFTASTDSQRGGSTATFTRATVSSRIANKLYATVTSGTAAISQVRGDDFRLPLNADYAAIGVHIGEAVTFDLLSNLDLSGGAWGGIGSPTITVNQAADPFGNTTCDRVDDDQAGTLEGVQQTLAGVLSPDEVVTASTWVRCDSGHTVSLRLTLTGGDTPVVVTENETCGGNLIKMVATATNNNTAVDNTDAVVALLPTTTTPADTGIADFCYPQFYQEPFETIREESQTISASTINLESLTYSSVAYPSNGTACMWWWGDYQGGGAALLSWDNTSDFRLVLQADGTIDFITVGMADTTKITSTTTVPLTTWTHICAAWNDGTDMDFFVNGTEVAYGTGDDDWTAGSTYGTTLAVGQAPGGSVEGDAVLSRVKMWNRRLTAGQIKRVYFKERGFFP